MTEVLQSRPRRMRRYLLWTLGLLSGAVLIIPLIFIGLRCGPFGAVAPTPARDPELVAAWQSVDEHLRPEDQSFLTFPEWYIVFSADEYAVHLQNQYPSSFPFFASVRQYWQGLRRGLCRDQRQL